MEAKDEEVIIIDAEMLNNKIGIFNPKGMSPRKIFITVKFYLVIICEKSVPSVLSLYHVFFDSNIYENYSVSKTISSFETLG